MSLKNYIFTSINTKSNSSNQLPFEESPPPRNRNRTMASNLASVTELPPVEADRIAPKTENWLKKVWSFVSVEPVMICWILPSCFLYIATENLALEKSCRVNYGYPDVVCDNMIDKSINNIDCVYVRDKQQAVNYTIYGEETDLSAATIVLLVNNMSTGADAAITELEVEVCRAEVDSQILDSDLNVWTAPFDSVFGILMILFAGGWSDRKGRRKPCMLLPLLGELAALIVMLISAIFMKQLPLEFSSVLGKLLPALTGGSNLMLMGVYSYLTEMTAEKDRTFRFGIFAVFVPLIPIASVPFSGILFQKLRYIKLIMLCIPINLIGVLYIMFNLKEVKPKDIATPLGDVSAEHTPRPTILINNPSAEHPTFEGSDVDQHSSYHMNGGGRRSTVHLIKEKIEKNWCVQFFNPVVAIDCLRVVLRQRRHNSRKILILLLVMYFISIGPAFGEEPNEYNFTRIKLNWDGLTYSPFATYGNAVALLGTMIMVGGLSKLFHMSDALVGFLGTFCSAIARIIYAAATTATMMYLARTVDMFVSVRALTLKSIISTFVDPSELGRIFSIIGIIEAFAKFVFVSTYSLIYKNTLESWASAFYICSLICLAIVALLFMILYFIVKKKVIQDLADKLEEEAAAAAAAERRETLHSKPILPGENTHI